MKCFSCLSLAFNKRWIELWYSDVQFFVILIILHKFLIKNKFYGDTTRRAMQINRLLAKSFERLDYIECHRCGYSLNTPKNHLQDNRLLGDCLGLVQLTIDKLLSINNVSEYLFRLSMSIRALRFFINNFSI